MAEAEEAPVETPTEPPPPAPEEAPTPPPEEPPPPAPEEAPTPPSAAEESPTPPAGEPPTPAAEESAKPSKSNLAMEKRTSTMSRVRLQEPGDVAPDGEKEIKPEGEKRKSETERRKSDGRTSQSARGSVRESLRGSTVGEGSKEGILRRRSDRASKSKLAVGSVVSIRRTSGYGEYSAGGKAPKYMNSYKLDSDNPFQVEKVEKILKDVLIEALEDLSYDTDKCPKAAKWASSAIRSKVKEQDFDRYRFVVMVTIGEKRYHDMCCMVRFLWDIERDKYAMFFHENMTVFATALCFGVYYE